MVYRSGNSKHQCLCHYQAFISFSYVPDGVHSVDCGEREAKTHISTPKGTGAEGS
jgi:hypothetical protein